MSFGSFAEISKFPEPIRNRFFCSFKKLKNVHVRYVYDESLRSAFNIFDQSKRLLFLLKLKLEFTIAMFYC
jgi:hypothetical protein